MSIVDELAKTINRQVEEKSPPVRAAVVTRVRKADLYDIQFSDGSVAQNVAGTPGLGIGNAVSVACYPGKSVRYVIVGRSYKTIHGITTVGV